MAAATACCALLGTGGLAGCGDDGDSEDQAATPAPAEDNQAADTATGDPTGNTYDATNDPPDATIKIALKDRTFVPQYVTALPGQTVLWTNEDDEPHKLQAVNSATFASKKLAKGQTYKYTFPKDAERGLEYRCSIHPETMSGLTEMVAPR